MLRKLQKTHLFSKLPLQVLPQSFRKVTHDSAQNQAEEIVLPKYIERGPTDILKTLSTTVKRDPTAAHYKYHDDPYLTPVSVTSKRAFAMAQEAGRKAAKWIRKEHSNFFQHRVADPFIEAFAPKGKFTDSTPVTEDVLKKLIERSEVSNAWHAYTRLLSDKTPVSKEMEQSLLELLCYYNAEDPLDEELIEERWYKAGLKGKDRPRKLWKDNGEAEKLFNTMETKSSEAFCALIRGMSTYGQAEGAWQLYNQMLSEHRKLDEETFSHVIKAAAAVKEHSDTKWQAIEDVLRQMQQQEVSPSVRTLNSVLEAVSTIPMYRVSRKHALETLAEFRSIGIEPSLATHYHLLNIFFKEKGPTSNILPEILVQLENSVPQLQDPKDVFFFARAMEVCDYFLNDISTAKRIHEVLQRPEYKNFIGDSYKESGYYRHYVQLLCRNELPDQFMEIYNSLVPNIYTPEPSVFEAIVKNLEEHGAAYLVPQLWTDAVYFELSNREGILGLLVKALASGSGPSTPRGTNEEADPILNTARAIFDHLEESVRDAEQDRQLPNLRWSGGVLGDLLKIFLQYGDFDSANRVMMKLNQESSNITGFVPVSTLSSFVNAAIENSASASALMAVHYANEMGFAEAESMSKLIAEKLSLDQSQQAKLNSIVGKDLFKSS